MLRNKNRALNSSVRVRMPGGGPGALRAGGTARDTPKLRGRVTVDENHQDAEQKQQMGWF
jgi:hypothetical protein